MISLAKTHQSVSFGRMRAKINAELRKNNLLALSLEFGERVYLADAARSEAHKAEVLAR